MTPPPALILASSSPRRRELLATLGIPHSAHAPDVDETRRPQESPLAYVQRMSREKAHAIAQRLGHGQPILAADTVVILAADTIGIADDGEILGKPSSIQEARAMLQRLRGRAHQVVTAVTVLAGQREYHDCAITTVFMRHYDDDEIEAYIASGDPFDKAGGYAIQHPTFRPVARIEGSYTNVVGLPLEVVHALLAPLGWTFPDA